MLGDLSEPAEVSRHGLAHWSRSPLL